MHGVLKAHVIMCAHFVLSKKRCRGLLSETEKYSTDVQAVLLDVRKHLIDSKIAEPSVSCKSFVFFISFDFCHYVLYAYVQEVFA